MSGGWGQGRQQNFPQPTSKTRQEEKDGEIKTSQHQRVGQLLACREAFRVILKAFTKTHWARAQLAALPACAWRKWEGCGYWLCGYMAALAVWVWRHWKLISTQCGAIEARAGGGWLWRSVWPWPCSNSHRPAPGQEGALLKWFGVLTLWLIYYSQGTLFLLAPTPGSRVVLFEEVPPPGPYFFWPIVHTECGWRGSPFSGGHEKQWQGQR